MKYLLALVLAFVSLPAFAAAQISVEGLLSFVIWMIVVGLVFWLLLWLISYCALPEPFAKVAKIVLAVVGVFMIINLLLGLAGTPMFALGR